jgi:hypothetical protein
MIIRCEECDHVLMGDEEAALSPFSPNLENYDDGNESTEDENNEADDR